MCSPGREPSKSHWLSAPLVRRMGRFLMTEPRWHAGQFVELMRRGQGRVAAPFHLMKTATHTGNPPYSIPSYSGSWPGRECLKGFGETGGYVGLTSRLPISHAPSIAD